MKLYIGNLSYDTGEAELREALTEFEPIMEIYFPMDRESGRPRGFAFVTLADREKGEAAMAALDGKDIAGRRLKVNEAEDRRQSGGGPRRSPMEDPMELETSRKDDRPTLKDGTKVRYKGI